MPTCALEAERARMVLAELEAIAEQAGPGHAEAAAPTGSHSVGLRTTRPHWLEWAEWAS